MLIAIIGACKEAVVFAHERIPANKQWVAVATNSNEINIISPFGEDWKIQGCGIIKLGKRYK